MWTIARNEVADHLFRKNRTEAAGGGTDHQQQLAEIPEVPPDDDDVDIRLKLNRLLSLVQKDFSDSTKTIFERVIVNEESAADVAADLGMNQGAVREAKRRVLKRLRSEWPFLFGEWPFALCVGNLS